MNKLIVIGSVVVTVLIFVFGVVIVNRPIKSYNISEILPAETALKGNKNAKVYLVEFSDFECPACLAAKPIIDKIVDKYKDQIVFGYRHFPLPQHKYSFDASLASEAAAEQGKFWEMHEYLFLNQKNMSDNLIQTAGKNLGLNDQAYKDAVNSSRVKNRVNRDLVDAKKLGVNSTPTFFLNGKKLDLKSVNDLETLVASEINRNETR